MKRLFAGLLLAIASLAAFGQSADGTSPSNLPAIQGLNYLYNGTTWHRWRTAAGLADATQDQLAAIGAYQFSGNGWDRVRTNFDQGLIVAAGVTVTQTVGDQTNFNGRGLILVVDTTVVGTGSVTCTIHGKDLQSGKYYTLLAGAAITTVTTNVYTIYPGAPTTANISANSPLPRTWRVQCVANNANPQTYTVSVSVIN
jgi:hypothetical protein